VHSGVAAGILTGEAVGGDSRRHSYGGKMHRASRAQQLQEQREQLPGWQGRVWGQQRGLWRARLEEEIGAVISNLCTASLTSQGGCTC
jgi:hypothetical protein